MTVYNRVIVFSNFFLVFNDRFVVPFNLICMGGLRVYEEIWLL